jgi:hypothetical protein
LFDGPSNVAPKFFEFDVGKIRAMLTDLIKTPENSSSDEPSLIRCGGPVEQLRVNDNIHARNVVKPLGGPERRPYDALRLKLEWPRVVSLPVGRENEQPYLDVIQTGPVVAAG